MEGTRAKPRRERNKGFRPVPVATATIVLTSLGEEQTRDFHWINDEHLTSVMVDTVGYLQSKFNPCQHSQLVANFSPVTSGTVQSHGYPEFTFICNEGGVTCQSLIPYLTELVSPEPFWWNDFGASAKHHFITLVKEDMSLVNMIIELITFCKGNLIKLQALLAKWQACCKMYLYLLPRYPEKPWLAWNFAFKPFFKDAIGFFKSFRKAVKRIHWLLERSGKDTFVHYREDGYEEELPDMGIPVYDELLPWYDSSYPISHVNATLKLTKLKVKYEPSAMGMINFDASHMSEDWGWLYTAWFQSVGILNPVKIGWEAFPFSWLVDWFVTKETQLQLEAGSIVQGFNNATLKESSHSLKVTIEGEASFFFGSDATEYHYGDFKFTNYVRQPGLPKLDVPPFRVDLEWWNASILSALLHQHVRRGKW